MSNYKDSANYYEILEVSPDAGQSEIHRAYQRAKATYSQDNPALYSMFSKEEARELLRLIEEAYQVLGNQGTRKGYDEKLAQQARSATPAAGSSASGTSPSAGGSNKETAPEMTLIDDSDQNYVVKKKEAPAKASLPSGTGRTPLSTYQIDEAFEAEIAAREEFDGMYLQKIRNYRNISIDKLADATRISRPYLNALEQNDFGSLPAAVFVRGFVVNVARLLGLDENRVANSYMKIFKAAVGKK